MSSRFIASWRSALPRHCGGITACGSAAWLELAAHGLRGPAPRRLPAPERRVLAAWPGVGRRRSRRPDSSPTAGASGGGTASVGGAPLHRRLRRRRLPRCRARRAGRRSAPPSCRSAPKVRRRLRVLLDGGEIVARLPADRRLDRPPCRAPRAPHGARDCRRRRAASARSLRAGQVAGVERQQRGADPRHVAQRLGRPMRRPRPRRRPRAPPPSRRRRPSRRRAGAAPAPHSRRRLPRRSWRAPPRPRAVAALDRLQRRHEAVAGLRGLPLLPPEPAAIAGGDSTTSTQTPMISGAKRSQIAFSCARRSSSSTSRMNCSDWRSSLAIGKVLTAGEFAARRPAEASPRSGADPTGFAGRSNAESRVYGDLCRRADGAR